MNEITRRIADKFIAALQDTPVLILAGARQVGKSTFLRDLLPIDATYVTFDDISTRAAAQYDPDAFLDRRGGGTLIIDEAQLAPELMRVIKKQVDLGRRPGRFILSGSADVLTLPKLSESLAGRSEIFYMYPFSHAERLGTTGNFVDSVFSSEAPLTESSCSFQDLAQIIVAGGYPEASRRSVSRRADWFKSYITAMIQRDVREMSNISNVSAMPTLLGLLARRSGNLLNMYDIARMSGVKNTTLQRYIALLETVFLVYRCRPWHKSVDARLTKSPKVYLNDTGLLCHILDVALDALAAKKSPFTGAVLENFVFNELQKQGSWSQTEPQLYFFRTANGKEVDFLLESRSGLKVGIEVKAAAHVTAGDFSGLEELKRLAPGEFYRGIVLYTGNQILSFGRDFFAIPITALFAEK